MSHDRNLRRELAAVALALLLPVPLFAAGLRVPLPGIVERGLASLAPVGGLDVAVVAATPVRAAPQSVPAAAAGVGKTAIGDAVSVVAEPAGGPVAAGAEGTRSEADDESTEPQPEAEPPPAEDGGDGEAPTDTPSDAPSGVPAPAPSVTEEPTATAESTLGVDVSVASAAVTVADGGVTGTVGAADAEIVVEATAGELPGVSVTTLPLPLPFLPLPVP